MASIRSLTVTEDGLHLPRELFREAGEVEVIDRREYILIRPRSATDGGDETARARQLLRESGLEVVPDWPPPPLVSPEERAELARKLTSAGRPLSEIILEDRAES